MCSVQLLSCKLGHCRVNWATCRGFSNDLMKRAFLDLDGRWHMGKRSFAQADRMSLIVGGHGHKVAVEPEAFNGKAAKKVVDGSILTGDGSELQNTVRLVECAMLAATAGLAFFLSNLFRLEGYLACFFPLPVVISSMRWGASAGRKTTVATCLLLLVLSGPQKSAFYLLMHGSVGLAIGCLWRWRVNWLVSLLICTVVRCFGALGFVLLSSWLLRENLLFLITVNAHASVSYMLAALGINVVPTMLMIYFIFGILRLGIERKIAVPGWIERAA